MFKYKKTVATKKAPTPRFKKYLAGLIVVSAVFLPVVVSQVAYAAVARCYAPVFPGAGVINCADKQDTYPSSSGKFEDNKCYTLRDSGGFGLVYFETDCAQPPFSVSSTNPNPPPDTSCSTKPPEDICHNVIVEKYINPFINFLGIGFGIIITITIVVGGLQYITAGSDPQKVAAAKGRIVNAIFTLVIFGFMYALLQWLVPGGIF